MNYVIVGLGNPDGEYTHSRHNAGRSAVTHFVVEAHQEEFKENKKANALVAKGDFGTAVLPNTYMNKSGSAVLPFVKSIKAAEKLVVIYDDIDLPLGSMRIAFARGSGGHKGVESVARALKTKNFIRIRIGVSKPKAKGGVKKPVGEEAVVDFVLGKFSKSEHAVMGEVYARVAHALDAIVAEGKEVAMNRFNQREA